LINTSLVIIYNYTLRFAFAFCWSDFPAGVYPSQMSFLQQRLHFLNSVHLVFTPWASKHDKSLLAIYPLSMHVLSFTSLKVYRFANNPWAVGLCPH